MKDFLSVFFLFTRYIIDTAFICLGYWTYVMPRWLPQWYSLTYFLVASIVLPLLYDRFCVVLDSMGYKTPLLYWVHDITIHSILPTSSVGDLQFLNNVALVLLRLYFWKNRILPHPIFLVFLLYQEPCFGCILILQCLLIVMLILSSLLTYQSRRTVPVNILISIGILLGITSMFLIVSFHPYRSVPMLWFLSSAMQNIVSGLWSFLFRSSILRFLCFINFLCSNFNVF